MPDWKKTVGNVGAELGRAGRAVGRGIEAAAAASRAPTHVCAQCGYKGKPEMKSNQNGCFALVLLLCFIIPGILYIIFTSGSKPVCPKCGGVRTMIPLDTPQARVIASEQRDERDCPFCAERILAQARVCKHCGREVG